MAKQAAPQGLIVHKLASLSYDPKTGEPIRSFSGLVLEPRQSVRIPRAFVAQGQEEGWLVLENARPVHKPGGPEADPWRVTHTFTHADAIVLKTVDGDMRYRVTRQPDKYDGGPENGTGKSTEVTGDPETSVDWFWDCELDGHR